jgi:YD repeat-containing protein
VGRAGLTQAYTYGKASQRVKLTDPDGGIRSYVYDDDGWRTVFQDPNGGLTTIVFDGAGRKTGELTPAGISTSFVYDGAYQVLTINGRSSTLLSINAMSFAYDPNGSRLSIWDLSGPSLTTYAYDPRDRLVQEARSGANAHTYQYAYDATDNVLYSGETGTTFTCDAAGRIVTGVDATGTSAYIYDPNGSLTDVVAPPGAAPVTMVYDKENRLTLHEQGSTLTTFTYSGDGLKRSETDATGTTTLVWDGDDYLQGRG